MKPNFEFKRGMAATLLVVGAYNTVSGMLDLYDITNEDNIQARSQRLNVPENEIIAQEAGSLNAHGINAIGALVGGVCLELHMSRQRKQLDISTS